MTQQTTGKNHPRLLSYAPEELLQGPLRRLGEGIGKVIYASDHWVVKRERPASEILALILIWKSIRKLAHILPSGVGERLLQRPGRKLRALRIVTQGVVLLLPRSLWYMTHIGEVWRLYRSRDLRGEHLAKTHLTGTELIPERVMFPPVRVQVGGWPGWLTVCEATERVECTLFQRLAALSQANEFEEVEIWLNRYLDLRQAGWRHGLFSVDAHLKNFGITGDRVVLLDAGGLTDRWAEIEKRLSLEEDVELPHTRLGLGELLEPRPDIAERFDERWKSTVNREQVRRLLSAGQAREPSEKSSEH